MTRGTSAALAIAAANVGLALALEQGALRALAPALRAVLAFVVLLGVPGAGWARAIGARPACGRVLAAGGALACGVVWLGLLVLVSRALGMPFTALAHGGAAWSAVPWLASIGLAPRASGSGSGRFPRAAAIAIGIAALLAVIHAARTGPPITALSDSPDHLGTVRRMLASGDAFPRDAFFRDAGPAGVDPRKGLWHPCVALVCALSGADPVITWRALAAVLAGLIVLTAAAFAYALGGPLAAAAGAWGALLGYGGGLGAPYLGEAVLATKLADQFALATAAAMLVDLEQRSLRSRFAVVALALGTIATHVFGAIQFAIVFGALGVGFLVRDRAWSVPFRRLAGTAAACALAAAPYVAWRAMGAYAPVNPIHTESQGLLELAHGVRIVSLGALWDWLGPLWVVFPCSLVWWWRSMREPAVLYLLTTTLAVGMLMLLPPVVAVLEPKLGYLLMRLPWLLPVGPAVAYLVARVRAAWSGGLRARAIAPALVLLVALAGPLADAARSFAPGTREPRAARAPDMSLWTDALAWMDRGLPQGSVVLSDPATSYSIPAFTRHWVIALADQHSSPNDSLALRRILDARDALDPFAPWSRTAAVVERWGATAVALNGRFPEPPPLDYWAPSRDGYDAARARLERAPEAFQRVYEHDRFTVYVIHRDALGRLTAGDTPRAYLRAHVPGEPERTLGPGLPTLVSFRMDHDHAAHGDTLAGRIEWRAASPLVPGAYHAALRFDRALPAGVPHAPAAFSKLWRKLVERVRHERYRFRADHLPTNGGYGVDRWSPGEVVQDSFRLTIPADAAAGDYTVRLALTHQPHYSNLSWRDMVSDDDLLNGLEVAKLRVLDEQVR